eukprot:TRINITY_DN1709_c0_g1_i1.p2 TRINITY_DN1709_c0_g1~~TRINITY_DN1709_c0_g1_i1.p2  ORF type:complete len:367 (+),score=21.57 TRINITY_DN1709_c0_g1_i1:968-2068(+)
MQKGCSIPRKDSPRKYRARPYASTSQMQYITEQSLPLLPQLIEYLWESDDLLIEDALASLAVLLKLAEEVNLDDFITLPMLKMLIAYSKDDKKEIKNPALMCVLSVSSADDKFGPMLIKAGALEMVEKVIKSRNYAKICEVCLLLSNLAAAGVETIQKILRFGIYSEVQKLLRDDNLYVIREVVWIVQNTFFIATEEQLDELVGKGLLELTVDLLRIRDTGLQTQILRFLEKFMTRVKTLKNEEIKEKVRVTLYESKGIDKVDMLCMHYNKEIAGLAEKVIEVDSELAKESTRFNNQLLTPCIVCEILFSIAIQRIKCLRIVPHSSQQRYTIKAVATAQICSLTKVSEMQWSFFGSHIHLEPMRTP